MKNIEAAKELLEKYKSITLEQLEQEYRKRILCRGNLIMSNITNFGTIFCVLCTSAGNCNNCIYSFRINEQRLPCKDIIYKKMENATSAEELYNAIQKRISYLTHIIEWYETIYCKR